MLVDLTTQLDKTQRLLRRCWKPRAVRRSEQLSADQLRLFAQESMRPKRQNRKRTRRQPTARLGLQQRRQQRREPAARTAGLAAASETRTDRARSQGRRKHCDCCNQDLRPIGEETSERYEYIPAAVFGNRGTSVRNTRARAR